MKFAPHTHNDARIYVPIAMQNGRTIWNGQRVFVTRDSDVCQNVHGYRSRAAALTPSAAGIAAAADSPPIHAHRSSR